MTVEGLRPPVTRDQTYLAAMCGLLAEQNRLLGEVLDRLSPAVGGQPVEGSGDVALREPAEAASPAPGPSDAQPDRDEVERPSPRRPTTKKTNAATRRGTKGAD